MHLPNKRNYKKTMLSDAVEMLEEKDDIQKNIDGLGCWAYMSLMKFNKAKCNVLHLSQGNPRREYRLGDE